MVREHQHSGEDPVAEPLEVFEREAEAFRRQRARLLRQFRGEYVVIHQGRVVAHGPDNEALAQQMYETLGSAPFYVGKVEEVPTVYELPSPEVVR